MRYNKFMREIRFEKLEENIKSDLLAAEAAAKRAFPRSRDVRIGAVVIADGKRFEGANVVKERFVGSTCAERMALDQALFAGVKKIERMVIIGKNDELPFEEVASPCGNCRQMLVDVLADLRQEDLEIILSNSDKSKIMVTSVKELLPLAYRSSR